MKARILLLAAILSPIVTLQAIVDTNENGLSDLWEKQHNDNELFSETFDPAADPDADGWTNAQEAAAGTDPFSTAHPDGHLQPETTHIPATWGDINNDNIPDLLTPEVIQVSWPTIAGKQYTLQSNPTLVPDTWTIVDVPFIGEGSVVSYNFISSEAGRFFWRVGVEDIDSDGDGLTDAEEYEFGTSSLFSDTNDDGIDDATAAARGLDPAGETADADGDGNPDNVYYSVEFEFTYETHYLDPPYPFPHTDRKEFNSRYLTHESGSDYSVSDSFRYQSIADGKFYRKTTALENGTLILDGPEIVTEEGQYLGVWLAGHQVTLGENEYLLGTQTQKTVSDPVSTVTNETTHRTQTTTYTTPWTIKKRIGQEISENDPVVRSGSEVIVETNWSRLSELMPYPVFWRDYVKPCPWETFSQKRGPLYQVDQLIGGVGYEYAALEVRDAFKTGTFGINGTISSPDVYWGGIGRDERLKSVRWRWVRFNPLNPFEYDHAAPPASYRKTFRLPVTQRDRLGADHMGDIEDTMAAKGVIEIECLGTQGGTGWHEVTMERFESYRVEDPVHLQEIGFTDKLGDTDVTFQNMPIEVVSRDRMIAGKFTIPQGWEEGFEIQFVNTTTGEDLGTYGHLLDSQYGPRMDYSDSNLFNEWEQQTYEAGNLDPKIRTQNVIFCGNRIAGYPIEFYTVFGSAGDVEIRLKHNGSQVGVLSRTLTEDAAFGRIIDYVNEMVGDPSGIAATAPTGALSPLGESEVNQIRPLAKRALIPFFNGFGAWMSAQTDVEALILGLLDGFKQGVLDDMKLIEWVHAQNIQLTYVLPAMLVQQVQRWIDDPYTRAMEAANAIRNAVQHGLIEPMQGLGGQLGDMAGNFSSWERFKDFNWRVHMAGIEARALALLVITDSAGVILEGLGDWHSEFCERMYAGAELGVFQSVSMGELPAWRQDLRTFYRTFGYSFGYLGEQLLLGHGIGALAKGMAKTGPKIALTTLPAVKSFGVRILPFLNNRWAARVITTADHEAAERAIRAAQTTRSDAHAVLQSDGAKPLADWLDEAVARQTGSVNGKLLAEEIGNSPKILQSLRGGTSMFFDRLALMEKLLGAKLDDVVARNFTQFYEKKLLADASTGTDFFEDMLVAVHTQYLSGQRPILDQLKANAASLDRLEVFFKGPPPFSPWKAGFETADSFGDSSRGLLIQLHEVLHGKYLGWTNLDILKDGKVVRAAGVDLVHPTDAGHFVQITTTAASAPNWVTKLASSAEAVQQRGGNKLTFEVFWLENNGRPAASLQALEDAKGAIQADTGIIIEISDTASKFDHWAF